MSHSNNEDNIYHIHIYKRNYETSKQFDFRKKLYDKIVNDIKDNEKALIYSNIWINILSMGCSYPDEVMKKIEKYRPIDELNPYQ